MLLSSDPQLNAELQELLKHRNYEKTLQLLNAKIGEADNSQSVADLARVVSLTYFESSKSPEIKKKAYHYAFLAGESYLRAQQPEAAIAMLVWLRSYQDAFSFYEKLERFVVQVLARKAKRRTLADEHLPTPTPFQEMKAKVSVESMPSDIVQRHQLNDFPQASFPLLSHLKAGEVARLLRIVQLRRLKKGELLFNQGEDPKAFFVVAHGRVELEADGGRDRVALSGDFLGDIALFGELKHSAKATAVQDTEVLAFPKLELNQCFQYIPRLGQEVLDLFYRRLFLNTVHSSLIFRHLDARDLDRVWEYFVPIHVPAGRVIIEPNRQSDRFFFVLKGKIEVRRYGESCVYLGPGHFVGERGLVLSAMRTATLTTVSDCQLLECDAWSFQEICQDFPHLPERLEREREDLEKWVFDAQSRVVD